ncbi:hypothetical protein H072_2432 [Dactylellina haptotyla CBS 200.50]|uniref:FAD-binding domain-containing protein n=1 Tax=Dactylellina haptotyla (strain CBS 200.50) TaxID=1284197 RepID=S8AKV7_DACHA|nr:hypothetical protein H072_2432 [Dactylellina haptotyla CBS 200.50]
MRVLISGAGIAGPSLAWFLAKAGARITTVEKSNTILPHGQNVDIQGSARKVIKKMGLVEAILARNTTEKGTQFIDANGRPFAALPVKEGSSHSFTSEFEILRGDLAAVFYEATKDHPNVNYLFNTTVKQVISNDNEAVKVELSTGQVETYDLLVIADGQWSKLRKQCFPQESIKVVDKNMFAVYWTVPRISSDNDWWNVYMALNSRIITLRPDPYGTTRAMFTRMPLNEGQKTAWLEACRGDRQTQEQLLRKEFADAGWQAQRLLDSIEKAPDFYFQPMQQIKMDKWSTGRVICLGDTAYAPTPLTGMGTSLAINGAYVLAGELSNLGEGEHLSEALDAYEKIFRPFVEVTQEIPWFVPGVAHPDTAWKRWLLQTGLSTISQIAARPWLANRIASLLFGDENGGNDDDFSLPEYPVFEDGEEHD